MTRSGENRRSISSARVSGSKGRVRRKRLSEHAHFRTAGRRGAKRTSFAHRVECRGLRRSLVRAISGGLGLAASEVRHGFALSSRPASQLARFRRRKSRLEPAVALRGVALQALEVTRSFAFCRNESRTASSEVLASRTRPGVARGRALRSIWPLNVTAGRPEAISIATRPRVEATLVTVKGYPSRPKTPPVWR